MPCRTIDLGNGAYAIACTRGRNPKPCCSCGRPSSKLCDFPLKGNTTGQTCDRPICEKCAKHVPPDTDYCPTHAQMQEANHG